MSFVFVKHDLTKNNETVNILYDMLLLYKLINNYNRITSSLQVWCPISCAISSGVLSCLFRCVGSAPARSKSFIASALSCLAQRCKAVSPSIVVLSIPPVDIFCTKKSIICKLFPISRKIAKCNAVSPRS